MLRVRKYVNLWYIWENMVEYGSEIMIGFGFLLDLLCLIIRIYWMVYLVYKKCYNLMIFEFWFRVIFFDFNDSDGII